MILKVKYSCICTSKYLKLAFKTKFSIIDYEYPIELCQRVGNSIRLAMYQAF